MLHRLQPIPKEKLWDYLILGARFLIGYIFLSYGYSKLVDGQFGISEVELSKPVKDLSLFKLSWYLFDQQPFKAFIGISQIICGALLIINRTAILGAFMFLPIVTTILIIDLTFMPPQLASAFAWRLSFYILLDLLILWHYRERMEIIWRAVWDSMNTKFRHPVWAYLLLPFMAIAIEVTGLLPKILFHVVVEPELLWSGLQGFFSGIRI